MHSQMHAAAKARHHAECSAVAAASNELRSAIHSGKPLLLSFGSSITHTQRCPNRRGRLIAFRTARRHGDGMCLPLVLRCDRGNHSLSSATDVGCGCWADS